MLRIVRSSSVKWVKCSCCDELIKSLEPYHQLQASQDGQRWKPVKSGRYCPSCVKYAEEDIALQQEPESCKLETV